VIISPLKIFAGSSHEQLARDIVKNLSTDLGKVKLSKFASNEIYAKPEESVRGADVFIVQTCTENVNDDLMELFILCDAMKRSGALKIHVLMPHLGYSRQDRVASSREPISAKVVAKLMAAAGVDHLVVFNLHSDQVQGFFDFPVDNMSATKLLVNYFKEKKLEDLVVVAPDTNAARYAKNYADMLNADLAILHKQRPAHNMSEITQVVGDVEGKTCLIIDDMIDTGGTVVAGRQALLGKGAKDEMYLGAVHGVFSQNAVEKFRQAGFAEVVVTDTIPLVNKSAFSGLKVLSVAPIMAKVIRNVHESRSVTDIFDGI